MPSRVALLTPFSFPSVRGNAVTADRIARGLGERGLAAIPQAARLDGATPSDLETRWSLPEGRVLFVFPAGIRPVKDPRAPLEPLGRVAARLPGLRLLYVGPLLDPAEGASLLAALA